MKKYLPGSLALCLLFTGTASAADFIAVRVEAENFTSKSDRWTLTTPDFLPDVQPDPDPPHNASASGSANLELLPDTRATHADALVAGGNDGNFWGSPGDGPSINYEINVPQAGRYYVYVKTFSTNTEDNGIHVGVNGSLPASGQRIQTCSKNKWVWTSGQRTGDNHCGITKTIWLDFPSPGVNTITFFAREDGFEIDQFLLLQETHDGSLNCFPTPGDSVQCNDISTGQSVSDSEIPLTPSINGNTASIPLTANLPEVDLHVNLSASETLYHINDIVDFKVDVKNNSPQNSATNTIATIHLPPGLEFSASADCTGSASLVSCAFGNVPANTSYNLSFSATVKLEGNHRSDIQVTADVDDNNSGNNIDSETVIAHNSVPDFEAGISLEQRSNASAIGDNNLYTVTITNSGQQQITDAVLKVTAGNGLSLQQCNPGCNVPVLATGESTELTFSTLATSIGQFSVTAELIVANDVDLSNNIALLNQTILESGVAVSANDQIVIEAEAYNSSTPAATDQAPHWFVVDENHTSLSEQLDPDNASPLEVSGGAYVELLPDNRFDESAEQITNVTNFTNGGVGSTLTYDVQFDQAGTYFVYARIRANNNQDASLHIGLNNEWPASSNSLSVCNPDGEWQWTNNIRSDNACNTASSATINVDLPGTYSLMVSQDTDGLELDKLILSKDSQSLVNGIGPAATTVSSHNESGSELNAKTSGGGSVSLLLLAGALLLLSRSLCSCPQPSRLRTNVNRNRD